MREFSLRFITLALIATMSSCVGRSLANSDADLAITRVITEVETVFPGQRLVPVSIRLENRTTDNMDITAAGLIFQIGGLDIGWQYSFEADQDNPIALRGSEGTTLRMLVDISGEASAGIVTIDATATIRRIDGSRLTRTGADEPDTWETIGLPAIIVTTSMDEDDTAGSPSIATAGGPLDISLREALLIANADATARAILFDPGVFPETGDVRIGIDDLLGGLPPITTAGVVIDGSGAGVIIDGNAINDSHGLDLQADDITLRSITVQLFDGAEAYHCVVSWNVDRINIIDSKFIGCGYDGGSGASVKLRGGRDHVVVGSRFQGGRRDGLYLADSPAGVIVRDNEMVANGDDGITVGGPGHVIEGNVIEGNGGNGAETGGTSMIGVTFRNNRFINNGSSTTEAGLSITGGASEIRVEDNVFEHNQSFGVRVASDTTSRVTITGNSFNRNTTSPIGVIGAANESVVPPIITVFDGIRIEGTTTLNATGATVEVYSALSPWEPLAETEVIAGAWSVDLPAVTERVTTLVTTGSGSTSEFSDIARTISAALTIGTAEDELDGGANLISVTAAGGPLDLSLREAITIANNIDGPDIISFSGAAFPTTSETTIFIGDEPLPPLIDNETTIDGTGANVVLDGGTALYPGTTGLLHVIGHDTEIRNITIRNFNSPGGACILSDDAERLKVVGCELVNCGGPGNGHGIRIIGSASQPQIIGNTIRTTNNAIKMTDTGSGLIDGNTVFDTTGSCIMFADNVDRMVVTNNLVYDCGASGLKISTDSGGNRVLGNQFLSCSEAGLTIEGNASGTEVVFNTVVTSGIGMILRGTTSSTTLQNNLLALNQTLGLHVTTTGTWSESHTLFFNNAADGILGTNAIDDGLGAVPDATDIIADPLLIDVPNGDVTPQAAVIDAGVDLGYDRNGAAPGLFNGAAPDIGAIETP